MKNLFLLLICIMTMTFAEAQKSAIISKVTATWCPNCGRWGWDLAEQLKADYAASDSPALFLGVHHSGNLESPVSDWFAKNLDFVGQPQFFVNGNRISVNSSNWESQLVEIENNITAEIEREDFSSVLVESINMIGNKLSVDLTVAPIGAIGQDLYLAVYIYENNVEDIQSSQNGLVLHPNVLRDVISDNYFGDLWLESGQNQSLEQTVTKEWEINSDYNIDELGVLAIMWKKDGTGYILDYATHESNWLSLNVSEKDLENIQLIQETNVLRIESNDQLDYTMRLFNQQGQLISQNNSGTSTINTSAVPEGFYILNVDRDNLTKSFKVFLK